jgi:hypothetical protein
VQIQLLFWLGTNIAVTVWRALIVLNVFDPSEEEVVVRISQKWKFSTEFLGSKSFPIGYFENSYERSSAQQWFKLEPDSTKSSEPVQGEIHLLFEYQSLENKPVVSGPTGSFLLTSYQHLISYPLTCSTLPQILNTKLTLVRYISLKVLSPI